MTNSNVILWVVVVFLCFSLLPGVAAAQEPDVPQLVAMPELVTPVDGAVTTGETDLPLGVPALAWAALSGATKYNIQISTSAGFANPVVDVTTYGLSFTPLTALADGEYFWRVRGFGDKEWGPFSTPRTFTKDWSDGGVLVPQLLSPADGVERTTFAPEDFSWQATPGAATYLLEISNDTNFSAVTYSATTIKPHHTPAQRLATNTYYWRVTPIDPRGNAGQPSSISRFAFRWNSAPQLLTPDDGVETPFVLTFTWTAVAGAQAYRLEVDTEDDFSSPALYTSYNTAFVWEQNLANDAEYFWRVQAVDEAGNTSDWSQTRNFRMRWNFKPQLLAPPNNSLMQASPVFHWTPIPGIERYHIQVDESISFEQPLFDNEVYNNNTATIARLNDPEVYIQRAYYWRVRGIDAQDNLTPWSDLFTFAFDFTIVPNPVYPLPYYTPDSATLPVHDDHMVAWPLFVWDTAYAWPTDDTKGLSHAPDFYELTVSTDPSFLTPPNYQIRTKGLAAAPTLQQPFTNLVSGQLYYWRVRAVGADFPTESYSTRVTRIDPMWPQLPKTDIISPTYPADGFEAVVDPPVLGWLPVNGAAHYKVEISRERSFATVDDTAYPQFVNYVPWQGRLSQLPSGTYWWRVRAESAPDVPLGDWSAVRHFNLAMDVVNGNAYDVMPPPATTTIISAGTSLHYSPRVSLVATNTLPAGDQSRIADLHVMLNRVNLYDPYYPSLADNLDWIIAFSTAATLATPIQYGIYIDVDHREGSGATLDPENHAIAVDAFYRPEYAIYVDRNLANEVIASSARLYKWNGVTWNPAQTLDLIGGDAWYDPITSAVQLLVPYTAIGAGDEDFSGSLALTVFSTTPGAGQTMLDCLPAPRGQPDCAVLNNPVFISDMLMPLYPFDTPFSNPTVYHELPALRWRTPFVDSIDGYQVQLARDAKFTDIVETWEIFESSTSPYFAMLPAAFQSLEAYEDNESYYWRVRIRHERYDNKSSHFDYGAWSPAMRFKLASRLVGSPTVSTGALANTTPSFWWERVEAAAGYTIQIDNDANFSNPEVNKKIDPNAFTLLDALSDGFWYWRVAIRRDDNVRGAWMPTMSFVKSSLTPTPLNPINGLIVNEQPTFQWAAVLTPTAQPRVATPNYRLQVAADPNFSNPKTYETAATSFTLKPEDSLSDGTWYWRTAAVDGDGNVGAYSHVQQFYKEYLRPSLLAPAQGMTSTGVSSFQWSPLAGAAYYEIEIDDDSLFNSPLRAKTDNTQFTPTDAMEPKQYYWRVRMVDADRQVGPFELGLVVVRPPVDTTQPNSVYLPIVAK